MNRNILRQTGLVVGGICIGGGAGYIFAMKRLQVRYEKMAMDGIEEAKEFYSLLRSEPPYDNPVTAAAKYRDRLAQLEAYVISGIPEEDIQAFVETVPEYEEVIDEEDEGEVFVNLQPNPEPEVKLEEPMIYNQLIREKHLMDAVNEVGASIDPQVIIPDQASRIITLEDVTSQPTDIRNVFSEETVRKYELEVKDELPQTSKFTHVISVDEFMEENHEMDKVTLMYYEGDDTLADDADKIVPASEVDAIIGKESLQFFGKGSEDDDIVYVKNTDRKMLVEITRDPRSYPVAVLGIPNSVLNKKVPRSDDG